MKIRLIRVALSVCVVLQVSFFALGWGCLLPAGFFMQLMATELSMQVMRALTAPQRLAGAALALPVLLTLCYGLWRLDCMLANFERRALFDLGTIAHLRAFAGATLLATLFSIVEPPLRVLMFRFGFGIEKMPLSIGVSSETLLLILVCGLFYLITNMMHEGRRLAEDNAGFI